jgi:hypothetical protein
VLLALVLAVWSAVLYTRFPPETEFSKESNQQQLDICDIHSVGPTRFTLHLLILVRRRQ